MGGLSAEASAPGRLDVMGGVADYSGSLLLQMALRERTHVRVRLQPGGDRISAFAEGRSPVALPLADLHAAALAGDWPGYRQRVLAHHGVRWPLYVVGGVGLLAAANRIPLAGAEIHVRSEVPVGAGLSSSAALEVATLRAYAELFDLDIAPIDLARLAQRVENLVVGAPCGLMDQIAAHLGTPGLLLPITCRPATVGEPIALPANLRVTHVNSRAAHDVAADPYATARAAAFMGKTLLEREHDLRCDYLAELDAAEFGARFAAKLPAELSGAEFLARYPDHGDSQTRVAPDTRYPVRAATAHPIYEHARITRFAQTLRTLAGGEADRAAATALGDAMYASHASYTAIGLGHPATDAIVARARALGPERGYYGARVTGGGSGGAVCVLSAHERPRVLADVGAAA